MTNQNKNLSKESIADDLAMLRLVKYSMISAIAGKQILSKQEWDQSFVPLMHQCSEILKEYDHE